MQNVAYKRHKEESRAMLKGLISVTDINSPTFVDIHFNPWKNSKVETPIEKKRKKRKKLTPLSSTNMNVSMLAKCWSQYFEMHHEVLCLFWSSGGVLFILVC